MGLLQTIGRLLIGQQAGQVPAAGAPPMPPGLVPGSQSPLVQAFANSTGMGTSQSYIQSPIQQEPFDDTGGASGPPMPQSGVNTEAPQATVPTPGDGPSIPAPAAAVTPHHTGGILGALGSVFMPKADSLWAGALRNGLARAHESQDAYKSAQATVAEEGRQKQLETITAATKLQSLLRNGEYRTVGNNVLHLPSDGSAPSFIPIPQNKSETERMLELWRDTPPGEYRDHIEMALKGADNNPKYDDTAEKEASKRRLLLLGIGARSGAQRSLIDYRNAHPAPSRAGGGRTKSVKPPAGFVLD